MNYQKKMNRRGSKIDPCGIPISMVLKSERIELMPTLWAICGERSHICIHHSNSSKVSMLNISYNLRVDSSLNQEEKKVSK